MIGVLSTWTGAFNRADLAVDAAIRLFGFASCAALATVQRAHEGTVMRLITASHLLQFGHAQIQQLHAELAKVDVRARTAAATFDIDNDAFAELGMRDVLTNAPAGVGTAEVLRNLVVAGLRRVIPGRFRMGEPVVLLLCNLG